MQPLPMATTSSVCVSPSPRESTRLPLDMHGKSCAGVKFVEVACAPAALDAGDKEAAPVEGCRVAPPLIDGANGRPVLESFPKWARSFFKRRSYQSLPIMGVITPQELERLHNFAASVMAGCSSGATPSLDNALVGGAVDGSGVSLVSGAAHTTASVAAPRDTNVGNSASAATVPGRLAPAEITSVDVRPAATAATDTTSQQDKGTGVPLGIPRANLHTAPGAAAAASAGSECADDEDGDRHLLHDILTMYGGIADLRYFVSTDGGCGEFDCAALLNALCARGAAINSATTATTANTVSTDVAATRTEGEQTRLTASGAEAGGAVSQGEEDAARNAPLTPLPRQAQDTSPARETGKHAQSISEEQQGNPLGVPGEIEGKEAATHLLTLCRVSRRVCGHKGVVHGGFTATLVDNAMGYFAGLLMRRPATKSLTVNYLRPLLTEAFVLVEVKKAEPGRTSSSSKDSTGSPSGKCHARPATPDGPSGTAENKTCTGSYNRQGSDSGMRSCTIEANVYTCIPQQLREAFSLSRESPSKASSQGHHERSSVQQETPGRGSLQKKTTEERGENTYCIGTDDRSTECSVSKELAGSCAGSSSNRSSGLESHGNRPATNKNDNSLQGGCQALSEDKLQHPPQSTRSGESLPSGVWLVAKAEAVFVDVSAKWKSLP